MSPSRQEIQELKAAQHDNWNAAGPGYSKWVCEGGLPHDLYDKFAETLGQKFGNAGAVQILDVASASGEPAVTVAKALPQAIIISTDLAESYLELGQARAAHLGLAERVAFQTADAEDLHRFPDGSMDVVMCSLGLMFMPAYQEAVAEFFRVLKPGGMLAVSVWHSMHQVPFFEVLGQYCQELDAEAPPASTPNMACRFGDTAAELLEVLGGAGFQDVVRDDVQVTFALPGHLWWQALVEMPLPLARTLKKLQEEGRPHIYEQARAKLTQKLNERGYLTADGSMSIPGNFCHFIIARK